MLKQTLVAPDENKNSGKKKKERRKHSCDYTDSRANTGSVRPSVTGGSGRVALEETTRLSRSIMGTLGQRRAAFQQQYPGRDEGQRSTGAFGRDLSRRTQVG